MRLVVWLLRGFVFFTLFAFALNNQQNAVVRWFFGAEWHAPMVIIVLVAFAAGAAIGVLAMVPAWWRHRRLATRQAPPAAAAAPAPEVSALPSEFGAEHPPRDGL
ncbi:MAG: LapA family protein [Burkholderiales bacterium]|nr:LapA family protein [Burkholderiales bacterium]